MERLQRILSSRGIASRRVAEEMIQAGRVSVNGTVVTELGTKADPERDEIKVDGQPVRRQRLRYLMLNKPRDYITTMSDDRDRKTVMDLVRTNERVYPVGRLDRDTEGLLLLTNDGELANRIMHPRFGLEKEYHVLTSKRPSPETLQKLRHGLPIDGKKVVPNDVRIQREIRDGIVISIALHEGMYHVVRRLMDAVGIEVDRLMRVRVGPISVTGVAVGTWRELTPGEQQSLFEAVHLDMPESEAAMLRETDLVDEQRRARKPIVSRGPRPVRPEPLPAERLAERQARPLPVARPAAPQPGRPSAPADRPFFRPDDRRRPVDRRPTDDRPQPRPYERGQIRPDRQGPPPVRPAAPFADGERPQRRFNPQRDNWGQPLPPVEEQRPAPAPRPQHPTHRDTRPRPGASYNPRWTDRTREADERAEQERQRRAEPRPVKHDGRPVKPGPRPHYPPRDDARGPRREEGRPPAQDRTVDRGPRQDARPPFPRRDDDRGPRQDARPPFPRRDDDRGPRQDARPPFPRRDDDRGPRQDSRPRRQEPERNDRVKVWRKEGVDLPTPTPRRDERPPRPRREGPGDQRTSERRDDSRGPRPPAGDRDRRPGGSRQDDRRPAPRGPRRGDAV